MRFTFLLVMDIQLEFIAMTILEDCVTRQFSKLALRNLSLNACYGCGLSVVNFSSSGRLPIVIVITCASPFLKILKCNF